MREVETMRGRWGWVGLSERVCENTLSWWETLRIDSKWALN